MARNMEMDYSSEFNKYVELIVNHPNYKGLFFDRNSEGKVNWVVTGKSSKGLVRTQWWDDVCKKLGIPIKSGCYAKAARAIHPTGKHVCQCCGKELSIFYEYPGKRLLNRLNQLYNSNFSQSDYTIKEIIDKYCNNDRNLFNTIDVFNADVNTKEDLIKYVYDNYVRKESSLFSPGVMSNCPDRFDGFHSYGICCRKEKDTGRHDDNMKTYSQDRRAYEEWADGNWHLANRLMGAFHKCPPMKCPVCGNVERMSADHIGPISLGFCHSTFFAPMCSPCNSSKNNRFSKSDVDILIELEKKGAQVISWHSKWIWDILKNHIYDDESAKFVSSIMAKSHQNVLNIFAIIYKHTGEDFLSQYLHVEFSKYDYDFPSLDLGNLNNLKIVRREVDSKNRQKNQERYVRIAFESLIEFSEKNNRKNYFVIDETDENMRSLIALINTGYYKQADSLLCKILEKVQYTIARIEYPMLFANAAEPIRPFGL